jgi:hypothetical protein
MKALLLENLAAAKRAIADGEREIEGQKLIIEMLRERGLDAEPARSMLTLLQAQQNARCVEMQLILDRLDQASPC